MRRRIACAAIGLAASTGLIAAPAGAAVVLDDGHVDYAARMIGGELQSQVKDGTGASVVWREPAEVLFGLGPGARTTIPQGSKIGFLGPPGTSLWMIPQVQRAGVLWAGWNTEEINGGQVSGGVTWQLTAVEGPGRVAVFQTAAFGSPDVLFDSADGLPDARTIPLGTHAHGNWAFASPGDYRLTFTMSAERAGGGPTFDTETLAVRVQGDPGSTEPGGDDGPGGDGPRGGPRDSKLGGVKVSGARVRGRLLTVAVRSTEPGRVRIAVRRAGRRVAALAQRQVGPQRRHLRFRLSRPLDPGRYSLRATVRTASARLTGVGPLRVKGRP